MLRTLKQLTNIAGRRALVRVDFNVPIDKTGVTDATRIRETLPTLRFLLKKKAKIVVMTHLGRPEGKVVDGLKLDAVSRVLGKLLKCKVRKLNACVGRSVEETVRRMKEGEIILLENIRFYPEEEACDLRFSKALAALGDFFVNDAFAACHRRHASTVGIARCLPSYAGFLVEQEIEGLSPLLQKSRGGLALLVGGAKIDTKIGLLKNFLGKADWILIGGALANTFLAAEGFDLGKSLYEKEKIRAARDILGLAEKKKTTILLPQDAIVADVVTQYATTLDLPIEDIEGDMKMLDIGTRTRSCFCETLKKAKTVIWNGPLGLSEFKPFSGGTRAMAEFLAGRKKTMQSCVGGGDTLDALARLKIPRSSFGFVSTGGGAMLEFLEGKKLPGIDALTS